MIARCTYGNKMDTHEIAAKFDVRMGYELVSYAEVAMPIFRVSASALVQGATTFSPIEEFVLRSLEAGLNLGEDISGFLGLDAQVVDGVVTTLIHSALVREDFDSSLSLTNKGREEIAAQRPLRPNTETISFDVDGLTRKAHWHQGHLHAPKDIKDLGLVEIRAIPVRRPNLDEIEVEDVDRAIQIAVKRESSKKVLRLREIFKAKRLFYDAVSLVYRGSNNDEVQVAFAIDGRLSEAHEFAFAKGGGLKKSGIEKSILSSLDDRSSAEFCGTGLNDLVQEADRATRVTRTKDQDFRRTDIPSSKGSSIKKENLNKGRLSLNTQKDKAEKISVEGENAQKRDSGPIKNIPVYEHPTILDDALVNSRKRVLIVSPWITPAVVNSVFISKVVELLERGVNLTIGYGIEERPKYEQRRGSKAGEIELQKLSRKYRNFMFSELGDTHAKILIKDSEYYVVTSFNWLSFRGDPNRKFREEWGTKVSIKENVDEFYSQIAARFPEMERA